MMMMVCRSRMADENARTLNDCIEHKPPASKAWSEFWSQMRSREWHNDGNVCPEQNRRWMMYCYSNGLMANSLGRWVSASYRSIYKSRFRIIKIFKYKYLDANELLLPLSRCNSSRKCFFSSNNFCSASACRLSCASKDWILFMY